MGIKAFFPTIKFGQVLAARRQLKKITSSMENVDMSQDTQKMTSVLSSFLIYDKVVKAYMKQLESFKGKWILEHQKFFFMATVANLHERGVCSTMLQHGVFFEPQYDFIPLLCDKVLCCSERERRLYIENGTAEDRVLTFGAPLQTLQLTEKTTNRGKHFDMLIMMTLVNEKNIGLIRAVLEHIKKNYNNVLVRMRPRSRKDDEKLLADLLQDMNLSEKGSSIGDDLLCCDKVVSFSVDANIEVSKYHKPFVYIWDGAQLNLANDLKCATINNYKEEISKLMKQEFYSSFTEKQYKEILGETDVNKLREKFVEYIRNNR